MSCKLTLRITLLPLLGYNNIVGHNKGVNHMRMVQTTQTCVFLFQGAEQPEREAAEPDSRIYRTQRVSPLSGLRLFASVSSFEC